MSDESEDLIMQAEAIDWSLQKALLDDEAAEANRFMSRVMSNLDGRKDAEIARLRAALEQIACRGDKLANGRLERAGSYSGFDEPGSVKIAREALSDTSREAP